LPFFFHTSKGCISISFVQVWPISVFFIVSSLLSKADPFLIMHHEFGNIYCEYSRNPALKVNQFAVSVHRPGGVQLEEGILSKADKIWLLLWL